MFNDRFFEKFQIPPEAALLAERMFSAEEAAFAASFPEVEFTEADIAGYIESEPAAFLAKSYKRGLISLLDSETGRYRLNNFYGFLDVFAITEREIWRSFLPEERARIEKWYFDAYAAGLDKTKERPTEDIVLPLNEVFAFIDSQENRPVYLNDCDCRSLSGECGLPTRTCITYRDGVNTFVHRGLSEKIDGERAKEIVTAADQAGLMHTVNENGICNCCGDCCYLFRAQKELESAGIWPKSKYRVRFDKTLCIGCGICVNRCHFGVFVKEGKNVLRTVAECIGCGLCVQTCPVKALRLTEQ